MVVKKILERGMNLRVSDGVIIVEHQDERGCKPGELIEQLVQQRRERGELRQIQERVRFQLQGCVRALESRQPVVKERAGALSASSRESQAARALPIPECNHSAMRVVLP